MHTAELTITFTASYTLTLEEIHRRAFCKKNEDIEHSVDLQIDCIFTISYTEEGHHDVF